MHCELGAIDLASDFLRPSRVCSAGSTERRACESRFQSGQNGIGNGQLELAAALPCFQPISRNRNWCVRAAEPIWIDATHVAIQREKSGGVGLKSDFQRCGEPGNERLGDTSFDARQRARLDEWLLRAVAA